MTASMSRLSGRQAALLQQGAGTGRHAWAMGSQGCMKFRGKTMPMATVLCLDVGMHGNTFELLFAQNVGRIPTNSWMAVAAKQPSFNADLSRPYH